MKHKPLILLILDGWGNREDAPDNAIFQANPVNFYALREKYPTTELRSCGEAVGLPAGQMGNSEVGHLNIGAGRVVYQEITRINAAISSGEWEHNPELQAACAHARQHNSALHLLGLVSDGGVHSHLDHLLALLQLAKEQGVERVYVHAFLDGRDVPPSSALTYLNRLESYMAEIGLGRISTLAGRYYGMDRDRRWERVQQSYEAMVEGKGVPMPSVQAAVEQSYAQGITDEFLRPVNLVNAAGEPVGLIADGDAVIFFNFRADRARELSHALVDEDFSGFPRVKREIAFLCLTGYDAQLSAPVAFPPQSMKGILAEVLAEQGLRQLRVAETEKYAHVTFFFNGQVETPFPGEDRLLIPSPQVATYDLEPEMSALQITSCVVEEIARQLYDVIIVNFANSDMVGHTGVLPAAVKAVQTLDAALSQLAAYVLEYDGIMLVTADHGNSEQMIDSQTGEPHTAHTTFPVPFILVSSAHRELKLRDGGALCDIAPTILQLLGIKPPPEMTGHSLLQP
jgi:2,3-bisphosphoglycerate-independent phosphoglycerate mutase